MRNESGGVKVAPFFKVVIFKLSYIHAGCDASLDSRLAHRGCALLLSNYVVINLLIKFNLI